MSVALALLGLAISASLTIFNARGDRVFRPAFLFSGVHAFYVFPKVLALSISESRAAQFFKSNDVDVTVAYMSLLCYLAFILIYEYLAPKNVLVTGSRSFQVPTKRVIGFALILGGFGLISFLGLVAMAGGLRLYFIELGFYDLELSGVTVWLIFLSRFTYPAIAALALVAALRPTRFSLSLLAVLSALPLMNVIFLFRRSDLLFLGFIALYAFTLSSRIRLNRVFVLVGIGVMALSISLFPYLRQESLTAVTGQDYGIEGTTLKERLADSLEVDEDDEIVRAASTIYELSKSGRYESGTFIWNSLIDQFVPATLVGAEAKRSWYIGDLDASKGVQSYFDSELYFYVAPMGFSQAFEQFGRFGWIIFALLGALIAFIERRSSKLSNQVFLMVALPIVCLAATNDITSLPARLVTFWFLTRFLGDVRFRVQPSAGGRNANRSRKELQRSILEGRPL